MESTLGSQVPDRKVAEDIVLEFGSYEEMLCKFEDLKRQNNLGWRKVKNHHHVENLYKLSDEKLLQFLHQRKRLSWSSRSSSDKTGVKLPFDNFPFLKVGSDTFTCHLGCDVDKATKEKRRIASENLLKCDHPKPKLGRFNDQMTKKQDCPATAQMLYIVKLMSDSYKMDSYSEHTQRHISKKFIADKTTFTDGATAEDRLKIKHVFILRMSSISAHTTHPVFGELAERRTNIDPSVKKRLCELVDGGVRSVAEARRHIKFYVDRETVGSGAPQSCRTWNPTKRDLTNMMALKKSSSKQSTDDQINLRLDCEKWLKNGDHYFLREGKQFESGETQSVLFVIQTEWQRRLLALYGKDVVLMDATHSTTRYDLPLFLLSVKTNIQYVTVAAFIVQNEDIRSITEALTILKGWNPNWKPINFMVDYCQAEIQSLQQSFPESNVLLCDFHREQSWQRYLNTTVNKLRDVKDEVLILLQNIAHSRTQKEYLINGEKLKSSAIWKSNTSFQKYYSTQWEKVSEKWVHYHRINCLDIHTNNGIERQNGVLKNSFLTGRKNCCLTELVDVLYNQFFPSSYNEYRLKNLHRTAGYLKYDPKIPPFLCNRPKAFNKHYVETHQKSNINAKKIKMLSSYVFEVPSESDPMKSYLTSLGSDKKSEYPSCECYSWSKSKFPCKHMIAIMQDVDGLSWNNMCQLYRSNPRFVLDKEVVGEEFSILEKMCGEVESSNGEDKMSGEVEKSYEDRARAMTGDLNEKDACCYSSDEKANINSTSAKTSVDLIRNQALELCKSLIGALCEADDEAAIKICMGHMKSDLQQIRSGIKTADGIRLKRNVEKKRSSSTPVNGNKLPKRKKRKDPFAGRVGVAAVKMRQSRKIIISDDSEDDFEMRPNKKISKKKSVTATTTAFCIDPSDIAELSSQVWLSDRHIDAGLILIKKRFPNVGGLRSTFDAVVIAKTEKKYVQIHHIDLNHWIISAFVNGAIMIYESLHLSVSNSTKIMIKKMYKNHASATGLEVHLIRYQQQSGFNDCGLFAIANAFALCAGGQMKYWDQSKMREHFLMCIKDQRIEEFPSKTRVSSDKVWSKKIII